MNFEYMTLIRNWIDWNAKEYEFFRVFYDLCIIPVGLVGYEGIIIRPATIYDRLQQKG